MTAVDSLLKLSALGIYMHGFFVSITLGFPLVIAFLLYKYSRTNDASYMDGVKVATMVLAVNFALGAVTGTLVEFGLVQIWPGTIAVIATSALVPLALELIAFAMEIALLVLFIVTLGRISPAKSILIILGYWVFALFSGLLITGVNSWQQAPWGVGALVKEIYPFIEAEYGPSELDPAKLLAVKILLLATGQPLQAIIQNPDIASKIGLMIDDPYIALKSPYAWASILHNLTAAVIVGSSVAVLAWSYRYYKTGDVRVQRLLASFFLPILILLLLQASVFGHSMGASVVEYNPTKFAMMERAYESYKNPIVGIVAYGDPNHPIIGFDELRKKCEVLGEKKMSDLAGEVGLRKEDVISLARELGVEVDTRKLDEVLNTRVKDVCLGDLEKAEKLVDVVFISYYAKLASAGAGIIGALVLAGLLYKIPLLTPIAQAISSRLGERKTILVVAVLLTLGVVLASSLGWYVREVGRKPWTVYGLVYPEEVVTVVDYASSPLFLLFAYSVILIVGVGGVVAMSFLAMYSKEIQEGIAKIVGKSRAK